MLPSPSIWRGQTGAGPCSVPRTAETPAPRAPVGRAGARASRGGPIARAQRRTELEYCRDHVPIFKFLFNDCFCHIIFLYSFFYHAGARP